MMSRDPKHTTKKSNTNNNLIYSTVPNHTVWIGGPDTILPTFVESCLGWALAIACLSVSGYHWFIQTIVLPIHSVITSQLLQLVVTKQKTTITNNDEGRSFPCWIPITTTSRQELDSKTPMERYQQLLQVLMVLLQRSTISEWTDDELVEAIQSSDILRRLCTLAMRPTKTTTATTTTTNSSSSLQDVLQSPRMMELGRRLVRLWPRLLMIPTDPSDHNYPYAISVIVPVHREVGEELFQKITIAYHHCHTPTCIQLIVVDAGGNINLSQTVTRLQKEQPKWGQILCSEFTSGGGRGPCFNYGASLATGEILTFLHSDTQLPMGWDTSIRNALTCQTNQKYNKDATRTTSQKDVCWNNSCAFSFGIDKSRGRIPPGIRAVETTANWRTHMYHLPYGDQCLSVPTRVFRYVGGCPDQCLLEDYELIRLLRTRVALLHRYYSLPKEQLYIIPDRAWCSPRRWQHYGVLYVTWTNSKCINLYAQGTTPDDLFQLYYGKPPPPRAHPHHAPWELEVEQILKSKER